MVEEEFRFVSIKVKNYRSINQLIMKFAPGQLLTICGANNVGKSNFLRALDLFFSMDPERFDPKTDIPHHIYDGSRGGGAKTTITGEFRELATKNKIVITTEFSDSGDEDVLKIHALRIVKGKGLQVVTPAQARSIVKSFRFMLIESQNINLPAVISKIFVTDVLPGLDGLKKRQSMPLETLKTFFDQSQAAVRKIELNITSRLKDFIEDVPGLETKDWRAQVVFPQFDTLREAISGLVSFTLKDSNDRSLETKGSGIQRVVLLSIMKYVADYSKDPCIWAIDEPEAFLQPGLQRKVASELRRLAHTMPIIISTHSPQFVDINDLEGTHLFTATEQEKTYARRPGQVFIKVSTRLDASEGSEKMERLRLHFGLKPNDGWHVMPHNVLVEGEEDKQYLTTLAKRLGVTVPNVFVAGGVEKVPGYLEFLGAFSDDLDYRPNVIALVDHDSAGKQMADRLRPKEKDGKLGFDLRVQLVVRADGHTGKGLDFEIEDWVYPEILFRAVNSILKRKGYKRLTDAQTRLRTTRGYYSQGILKFVSEVVRSRNPERAALDFESVSVKLGLCHEACMLIESLEETELAELDSRYPSTKALLSSLTVPPEVNADTDEII